MREPVARPRLRKRDRRSQILLELKLRPHLRISELAERFGVSSETVRRDFEALSADGLLSRAHGGGSAPGRGHYPGLDERSRDRLEERERIGRLAATLVQPGDAVMIDAGSTTLQLARFAVGLGARRLSAAYGISPTPATVFLKDGQLIGRMVAATNPQGVRALVARLY